MIVLLLARRLGPFGFGVITLGATLVGWFSLVVDSGTEILNVREVARRPDRFRHIAEHVLGLRLAMSLAATAPFVGGVAIFARSAVTRETLAPVRARAAGDRAQPALDGARRRRLACDRGRADDLARRRARRRRPVRGRAGRLEARAGARGARGARLRARHPPVRRRQHLVAAAALRSRRVDVDAAAVDAADGQRRSPAPR